MVKIKAPKFSILLPTYNRADVISYAIESVLAQTEKSFELLIVGDGCTDNTEEIVERYLNDKRIKWFNLTKAPGFGYANRNKVLKKSKGKYIAFMAHDDIIFPDHLKLLGDVLDNDPKIDIIYSRPLWVDPMGIIIPSTFNIFNKNILSYFQTRANEIPATCVIHRKSCFEKVGYWNDSLPGGADWDLWKRIINQSDTPNFAFVSKPTVFHFKAIWRTDKNTYPIGFKDAVVFIENDSSILPEELKINMMEGKTEQEVLWRTIDFNKNWLNEVRIASEHFLDYIGQVEFPKLLKESEMMKKDLAITRGLLNETESELSKIKGSIFYRLRKQILKIITERSISYRFISWIRRIS